MIIDSNKTAILIDFDRMIIQNNNYNGTVDFFHQYVAPEIIHNNQFSFESDIYSIGLLIYYIILEKEPIISYDEVTKYPKYFPFNDLHSQYPLLQEICEKCTLNDPSKRYNINELILKYDDYFSCVCFNKSAYNPIKFTSQQVEIFYKFHRIISPMPIFDTDELLNLSAYEKEHCNSYTLVSFGLLYYDGISVPQDINKSIYYLTLASNKNNSTAQFYLGCIYYEGKYISRDINKSIYYLLLSSNNNNSDAQFLLGYIYKGKYINQDIDKSIYYLTLSANNNNANAQAHLGKIDLENKYDANKGIHY